MTKMDFGKYRGVSAREVPMDYLLWCVESIGDPPACVLDELRRRAGFQSGRQAIAAQAAVASFWWRDVRAKKKQAKKRARKQARHGTPKLSGVYTGEHFEAARKKWLEEGGDPASIPW